MYYITVNSLNDDANILLYHHCIFNDLLFKAVNYFLYIFEK